MTEIFLVMAKRLPSIEQQPIGPTWVDMQFIRINDRPVPFKSEDDARDYMSAWGFEEPEFTVWKLTQV